MVKYLSFHKFFFRLKILFNVNGKGQSVTHPLLILQYQERDRSFAPPAFMCSYEEHVYLFAPLLLLFMWCKSTIQLFYEPKLVSGLA